MRFGCGQAGKNDDVIKKEKSPRCQNRIMSLYHEIAVVHTFSLYSIGMLNTGPDVFRCAGKAAAVI
jgi:hypothetical protein